MFQRCPLLIKIIVLCCCNSFVVSIAIWIFKECETQLYWPVKLAFLFLLTWSFIFASFILFQTFKNFRFPAFFYQQINFETTQFHRILGVKIFRWILVHSFFRYLNPRIYFKSKDKAEFIRIINETQQSETSHLLSGLPTLFFQVLFLLRTDYISFCMLGCLNIIFNVYPILLQRMNRFTFTRILNKFS